VNDVLFALTTSPAAAGAPLSVPALVVLVAAAGLALYVACKIARFLLKFILAVLVLAALAGVVWWFWLQR
jgi:hypothetical protein